MALVKASYQHRTDGAELVNHEADVTSHRQLCELIDAYPWASELALTEEHGEGGGFYFLLGDYAGSYASYQFVPVELDKGLLDFEVVAKPGFLKIFGRQSATKHFDSVSIAEAKVKIKELFDFPVAILYQRYEC